MPRVAAEQIGALAVLAVSDDSQAVPEGRGRAVNASPLFRLTPYIVFGAMCCAAAIVPSLATDLPFANAADAIALVGLFAAGPRVHFARRMDIGTSFGTMAPGAKCSSAFSRSRRC